MKCRFTFMILAICLPCLVSAQVEAISATEAGQQTLSMTYEGGRLSIRMQDAALADALQEMSRRTGVKINVAPEIEDAKVSACLSGVELDRGLRAVLSEYDVFLYYGGNESDGVSLRSVWVFPKGAAATIQPAPIDAWAGGKEIEALLSNPEPGVRQHAYEALMRRPDGRSRELVIQAIRGATEKDDDLRQRILSDALSRSLAIPADVLAELARSDNSEQVRWMALDALSQDAMGRQTAEAAMTDPSATIRQRAEEILAVAAADEHRREGTTRPAEEQP